MSDIPFNVQIDRVLDLLCSQIYDSPLSLLRENVQNAYDAILQRRHEGCNFKNPEIRITIDGNSLSIYDNGIGMDDKGLKSHYWTAGSSGKNNPEARAAGVVGTFGVGAMANFGVCTELKVESRLYGTDITWTSGVKKADLSLTNNCIYISESKEQRSDFGTTVIVTISTDFILTKEKALNYLKPYVCYLSVPVYLNDELISKDSYDLTISANCVDSNVFFCENGDLGDVGDMMSDYLAGKRSMQDIINVARANKQKQKQEVNARSVGSVSDVLGEHIESKVNSLNNDSDPCMPMPPIMRLDKNIDFKVLRTDAINHDLNNIKLFLSLSDKLYRDYAEFFYQPHTTNVIWSMHRVIFFFTHASNNLTH